MTLVRLRPFLFAIASVVAGLAVGLAATAFAGENPWHVFAVLARSAFGSPEDFAHTLFYATPLIFTGLSVAVAWRGGFFNIGAEGQLAVGALAAAAVGVRFPDLPGAVAVPFALACSALAGGFWGGLAGWMRVKRGSHEVITTILLNFVAAGLCSWVTLYWLKDPETQNPETSPVAAAYRLAKLPGLPDSPLSTAIFIALGAVVVVALVFRYGVWGFGLRAAGANEAAAIQARLPVSRLRLQSMLVAGALAGLVAAPEVLGSAGRFKFEFSPGYGFTGIAVAILARNEPWLMPPAALLFGALQKGALDLDIETENVTRELSLVLQALVILFVSREPRRR